MNLRGLMKKDNIRRLRIIEMLYFAKEPLSSYQFMDELGCSLPVLLNDLRFLTGDDLPFSINKDKRLYSIEFADNASIDAVYSYMIRSNLEYQIIECLLFEENESIQTTAKQLNCSSSNMQRYLITTRELLAEWDLELLKRPLMIKGDELAIRHFYYIFFKEARVPFSNYKFSLRLVKAVDQLIRQILLDNEIKNNMNLHFRLMHSFLIALRRLNKNHKIKRLYKDSGLVIPKAKELPRLVRLIRQETDLTFTETDLKECLWPLFSHQLILNRKQQSIVHKKNKNLASFYETHHFLLEEVNNLLTVPLSQEEMVEAMRLLGNELFCFYPDKCPLEIVQESDRLIMNLMDKKYSPELRRLKNVIRDFLIPQEKEDFLPLYLGCLVTAINNIFQRLTKFDKHIRVLLLSDASNSHERFWQSIFPAYIKGSVIYEYFETPYILQQQLTRLTKNYDLIVTNVTMNGLRSACPVIAINAYPTARDFDRIQNFINDFDLLPSRKELSNELTPTIETRKSASIATD
ncbi:helix-turn-helix domain-containing protein [Enterococcus hulanensis]|uniref:helix-turn-helix domain-containing protein n=1 Tax=Enterococcus hulanensis TaxID=2559929 RepID=UPI00289094C6|nr:helix-turn-helix domain-containing protein [Enterococcus hulanensis]MDT2662517.1 helix-turn-helix domain-containing protein [Enterococcus hulanensis]